MSTPKHYLRETEAPGLIHGKHVVFLGIPDLFWPDHQYRIRDKYIMWGRIPLMRFFD